MFSKLWLIASIVLFNNVSFAQQIAQRTDTIKKEKELIQFSGILVEADSLRAIPFTSIIVKNTQRGTISDYFGYFSFVAKKSDTIVFSAIGFKTAEYIIPDTLSSRTYSLIPVLRTDTILLQAIDIYPWPSKEEFKHAFLSLNLSSDGTANAKNNIANAKNQMVGMALDASTSYKNTAQQNQSKLYYAGQYPSNNILNPVAWAKFIKAWKSGVLKKK